MLKYQLAAGALKAFSLNGHTRNVYRQLGNVVGGRSRGRDIKPDYVERADCNLAFIEKNGAIADGMTVLELGTGWVHWESLFTRLFYDVEVIAFDIWDNRQFDGFMLHACALREQLPLRTDRASPALVRADELLRQVLACKSFEAAYEVLGIRYLIDSDGRLDAVNTDSVDLVYSSDVMEHIPESTLPRLADSLLRILREGGHVSQQIVQADHLCIYDRKVHAKNYLRYSERAWKLRFENDVQYVNRWQHSDFLRLFHAHGFRVVDEEIVSRADTSQIAIAPRWRSYDRNDLDATVTRVLVTPGKE